MHVCRVCQEFYPPEKMKGGLGPHLYNLSRELKSLGIRQTILTTDTTENEVEGIKIYRITPKKPFSVIRGGLAAYAKIKELDEAPDTIHFHNPGFASLTLKKDELPPIIMTLHDSPFEILKSINWQSFRSIKEAFYFYYLAAFAAKRVSAIICVSSGVANDILNRLKLNPDRVFNIPTGINPEIFYPSKREKDIDILFAGRFAPKKRLLDLVEAVKILKRQRQITAYFVGGTPKDMDYKNVIKVIREYDVVENITFLGLIPQEELRSYYQRAKVFVLPSIAESSPKVALESMACGTPVVATDILGNVDILINGKTGFLVSPKQPKMLAEKIKILLDDDGLRVKMGEFASKFAHEKFNWKLIAKKYLEIYEKVTERRKIT